MVFHRMYGINCWLTDAFESVKINNVTTLNNICSARVSNRVGDSLNAQLWLSGIALH